MKVALARSTCIRRHTSEYVCIRRHTSAYMKVALARSTVSEIADDARVAALQLQRVCCARRLRGRLVQPALEV